MKCEDAIGRIQAPSGDAPKDLEWRNAKEHVAACDECRDALRGAAAMRMIRDQQPATPPQTLFETAMRVATESTAPGKTQHGFWYGAGFGGAVAAALLIVVMTLGFPGSPRIDPAPATPELPATPEFVIALHEARDVNVAIEAGHDLNGATVSVFLSGGVQVVGFGDSREISWNTDLARGINQLTLPVIATDMNGGTLVVELDHEGMRRIFRIDLKLSG